MGNPCGQARGQAQPVHQLVQQGCPRAERSEPAGGRSRPSSTYPRAGKGAQRPRRAKPGEQARRGGAPSCLGRRICPTQESVHRQTTDKTKGPVFRLSLSFYLMPLIKARVRTRTSWKHYYLVGLCPSVPNSRKEASRKGGLFSFWSVPTLENLETNCPYCIRHCRHCVFYWLFSLTKPVTPLIKSIL